jgi:hypothetical protein
MNRFYIILLKKQIKRPEGHVILKIEVWIRQE